MKLLRLLQTAFAVLLLLPLQVSAENMLISELCEGDVVSSVCQWESSYGQVEVGDNLEMTFTIESLGPDEDLRLTLLQLEEDETSAFEITLLVPDIGTGDMSYNLPENETVEITVQFTPTTTEFVETALLLIFSNAGNYPVVIIALDGEGIGTPNGQTPVEMINALVETVISLNLRNGISNALDSKLDNVLRALEDANENNDVAAINVLYAFIYSVEAQRGNALSDAEADSLIADAQAIIDLLSE